MPSQIPHRTFLGWDQPILEASALWLWDKYAAETSWCLTGVCIVLPGRRAVREFSNLLSDVAGERGVSLEPPKVITTGSLHENLYVPQSRLASELEQTLAWCQVLRGTEPSRLAPLISNPPPISQFAPWLELAGAIRRLHQELSSENYTFAEIAGCFDGDQREASRWDFLHSLAAEYRTALTEAGRSDPYHERRCAIEENRCGSDCDIIVIGAVDLNKSLKEMIKRSGERVSILVGAPSDESGCFDDCGCVISERWMNKPLKVRDEHLIPALDADDQAVAAANQINQWEETFNREDITIGITDEATIAYVSEQLAISNIASYAELGEPLIRTAPGRLLSLVVAFVQHRTFSTLSSLVRHADVYRMLSAEFQDEPHWLSSLDQLQAEHFPVSTTEPLPAESVGRQTVEELLAKIDAWLEPILDDEQELASWCSGMQAVVNSVYDSRVMDLAESWRQSTVRALVLIEQAIERMATVTSTLQQSLPTATASELLIAQIADSRIREEPSEEQMQLVGWLDLALDTSKAMCVVGLNEPFVPESIVADPFLPGRLRHKLQLYDNDQRFARDAYALSVIVSSRPECRLVVGRTSADGSPTPPSRLLAACSPKVAANRTKMLLDRLPARPPMRSEWTTDESSSNLPIPIPANYETPKALSVTAFGDYLRCPYRFFLRHVAKLRPLDDTSKEMAANQYGNLVHDTLESFGLTGPKHSTDMDDVEACLLDTAADLAKRRFGERPAAPVRLQITSALDRLKHVARHHVQRARDGWLLWAAERKVDEADGAFLNVDGSPFGLKGRIDRIDYHEDSDMWAVIDYKTHGHEPFKKHFKKSTGEWIDLQLPLYRHMIRCLGVDAEDEYLQLGYFNIGEKESDIKVNIAKFSRSHFDSADEAAANVVRGVRTGSFEMNPDAATNFDDYGVICQTGIIDPLFASDQEDAYEEVEA